VVLRARYMNTKGAKVRAAACHTMRNQAAAGAAVACTRRRQQQLLQNRHCTCCASNILSQQLFQNC
jgi:hypothetical protein